MKAEHAPRGLYEKVLESIAESGGRRGVPPAAKVKASASVVLWRKREGRIEVFWVRRSPELAFMGGWHAFPGGGRQRSDASIELNIEPRGAAGSAIHGGMPEYVFAGLELEPILAPGIVAAALRELFEETGVLPGAETAALGRLDAARRQLLAGELDFGDIEGVLGTPMAPAALAYAGRWLTPPLGPVRFDNRFFLLEWPLEHNLQPQVIPGELAEGEWLEPGDALRRWIAGEVMTAPPILHLLKVLEEDGIEDGRGRLLDASEVNLGPFRRVEFRPGVLLFPLATPTLPPATHTNTYVLGDGEAVVIDPGSPFETETRSLVEALRELEAGGRRFVAIWLTHHHPDHVGGVEGIRNVLNVPVCAHPETASRLEGVGVRIDRELTDGETIRLEGSPGAEVRVVHTPGHARGHLVFLEQRTGALIAGDLVAGFGTIVIDPPEGDMSQYMTSLEKARGLASKTVFPGHGPPSSDPKRLFSDYIRHREWREEKIRAAWTSGLRDKSELLDAAYDDVQPIARPLAERQLEAHLQRLRELGKV